MNNFIMIFSLLANAIAILLVYYSFGKKIEKSKRMIDTVIAFGVIYIITLVLYKLSTIMLNNPNIVKTAQTYLIMAFVPVNIILFVPFLTHSYMKMKDGQIDNDKFKKRFTIIIIIGILIFISEIFYFRGSVTNIINMKINQETQNNIVNEENTQSINQTNELTNNITSQNNIVNEENISNVNTNNNITKNNVLNEEANVNE